MTNEQNFKKGDRVSVEDSKCSGIVTAVDGMRCMVRFDSGRVMNFPKEVLQHRDLPSLDRRTDFLRRLGALLREYDATIQAHRSGVDTVGLCISFGDGSIEDADYQQNDTICDIDADNIMEFEKE